MPDGILPDEGSADQLEYILQRPISGVMSWSLMLWVNDIEPDSDTVLGDLEEADFDGYSRVTLDRDMWTTPDVHDGCAESTWGTDAIVWHVGPDPDQTVYGYAMVDRTVGVIRFVQRFDDADIEPLEQDTDFKLLPQYTLTSAPCPAPPPVPLTCPPSSPPPPPPPPMP
jgi:hypothetical protein